jgi:A/G-specific adenine glycosylase
MRVGATYEDSNNSIEVKTALSPVERRLLPTLAASYSRRLFRNSPERGRVSVNISQSPSIAFFLLSPAVFHIEEEAPKLAPPSVSGLKYVAFERTFGITFDTILPKLVAEGAVHLIELSTRLRASIEYSLTGILATLGITWSNAKAEAGTLLVFSPEAVVWEIKSVCFLDSPSYSFFWAAATDTIKVFLI